MYKLDRTNGASDNGIQKADLAFTSSSSEDDFKSSEEMRSKVHKKIRLAQRKKSPQELVIVESSQDKISEEDNAPSMVHTNPLYHKGQGKDGSSGEGMGEAVVKNKKKKKKSAKHDKIKKNASPKKTEQKNIEEVSFQCEICNKSFPRNFDLARHKQTHTGTKPHKCDTCGKCFGQKAHLKKHEGTHDPSEKPEKPVVEKPEFYKCEECEKEFSSKFSFERHQNVHTEDRAYQCDICEKEFKQRSHLNKHMTAVHDESGDTSGEENKLDEDNEE